MTTEKTIFIQCKTEDEKQLAKLLNKLPKHDYFFIILPLDMKLVSKRQLISLYKEGNERI